VSVNRTSPECLHRYHHLPLDLNGRHRREEICTRNEALASRGLDSLLSRSGTKKSRLQNPVGICPTLPEAVGPLGAIGGTSSMTEHESEAEGGTSLIEDLLPHAVGTNMTVCPDPKIHFPEF